MSGFEDILAWQKAKELTVDIYRNFADCKDRGFKDQIQRAAVSISNNIAEGYARRSDKSFSHFLLISKGSIAEVQSMLIVAQQLNYINPKQKEILNSQAEETARLCSGLVKYLKSQDSKHRTNP
jgi:four helix bundle protein